MLFNAGHYEVKRYAGRVADLCSGCGQPTPFRVHALRRIPYVHFIPLGRGLKLGHTGTCERCGHCTDIDRSRFLRLERDSSLTIEQLCDRTNPSLVDRAARRLDAIDTFQRGEQTADERLEIMVRATAGTASAILHRQSEPWWSGWGMVGAVFPIVGVFAGLIAAVIVGVPPGLETVAFAAVGLGAGALWLWRFSVGRKAWFARRRIALNVVPTLADLQVTHADLERYVDFMKRRRPWLGRHLEVDSLERQVHGSQGR
ncbi:MAG: hypothetical protein AAF078_03280 [Planctomycetota bacterium]